MQDSSNREKRGFSDHPVYVAGVAVAGTIALSIAVYKEVILPAQLAASEFKISELSRQLEQETQKRELLVGNSAKEKAELSSALNVISSELQSTKNKLDVVNRELEAAKLGALFVEGLSYPVALDKVKVGEAISEVKKFYLASQIEEDGDEGFISVNVEHPFFHSVVYYADYSNTSNISHILYMAPFDIEEKVSTGYLQDSLQRAFGKPVEMEKDKYVWRLESGLIIFKDNNTSFIVAAGGVVPGNWDRVIDRFAKKMSEDEVSRKAK